jgi:hypothetical protein
VAAHRADHGAGFDSAGKDEWRGRLGEGDDEISACNGLAAIGLRAQREADRGPVFRDKGGHAFLAARAHPQLRDFKGARKHRHHLGRDAAGAEERDHERPGVHQRLHRNHTEGRRSQAR